MGGGNEWEEKRDREVEWVEGRENEEGKGDGIGRRDRD